MSSIFTKIVQGEIPSYKIAENDSCFAFLDIQPLREGHTLVIPKLEVDYIFDLPANVYNELWAFAAEISRAINASFDCKRIGVAVVGLEVPHAHIHLIPIDRVSDMDFSKPKLNLGKEQFQSICDRIKGNLK